jgi:pteridine reductase
MAHAPVALVTGAARRIGAAIARRLHAAGYDLALHCRRSQEELAQLAGELERARPGSVLTLRADLAEFDRLPELVAHTLGRFGRLDALVNNASAFYPTPLGTTTPAQWDELFASNARAPFFLAQAAAPHLRAARGAIVNLTDLYAERPLRQHTVYCMAKAALAMLTRSLAVELAPEVRVNAVAPGAILWPEDEGNTEAQKAMLARTPLGRTGTPEEVAEAVRWLLQDAHYSTGQTLLLDGGRTLLG